MLGVDAAAQAATPPDPRPSPRVGAQGLTPGPTGMVLVTRMSGRMSGQNVELSASSEVRVHSVEAASAADRAGLRAGDVILEVEGVEPSAILRTLGRPDPAARYVLRIRRGDEEREVVLTMTPPANGRAARP